MGWGKWVLIGLGARAIYKRQEELAEERERENEKLDKEKDRALARLEKYLNKEAKKRKKQISTVCKFDGLISEEGFSRIAYSEANKIKRLSVSVDGPVIYGTVTSVSGLSEWYFTLDFNDWGKITGEYWLNEDNYDSSVPSTYAFRVQSIIEALIKNNVTAEDYYDIYNRGNNPGYDNDEQYYEDDQFEDEYNEDNSNDYYYDEEEYTQNDDYDENNYEENEYSNEIDEDYNNNNDNSTSEVVYSVPPVSPNYFTTNNYIDYEKVKEEQKRNNLIIIIMLAVLSVGILGYYGYQHIQYQIGIETGISAKKVVGMNYELAVDEFEDAGFSDIQCIPIYDLSIKDIEIEYTVSNVTIDGEKGFKSSDRFKYDSEIIIEYHVVKDIAVPISSEDTLKMNYEKVALIFEEAGFVNINTVSQNDLITGWITKDGSVESVTVNGDTEFVKGDLYRPDVDIEIIYHTF